MKIQKTITYTDFSIVITQTPDASQLSAIQSLFLSCHQNGENVPEFPVAEITTDTNHNEELYASADSFDDEENIFLFLMRSDGSIPAVLSLSILDDETAGCELSLRLHFAVRDISLLYLKRQKHLLENETLSSRSQTPVQMVLPSYMHLRQNASPLNMRWHADSTHLYTLFTYSL